MADTNPEIEALIAEYDEGTVRAAFAIAQSIGEDGIPGIDFKGAAEDKMRRNKYIVHRKCEKHINRNLKSV